MKPAPVIAAVVVVAIAAIAAWSMRADNPPTAAPSEPAPAPTITPYVAPTTIGAGSDGDNGPTVASTDRDASQDRASDRSDGPPPGVRALPSDDPGPALAEAEARAALAPEQARALASREFRIGIQNAMTEARPDLLLCWEEAIAQGRLDDDRLVFDLMARSDDERGVVELTSIDSEGLTADDLDCFADVVSTIRIPAPDPLISDAEGNLRIRYPVALTVQD